MKRKIFLGIIALSLTLGSTSVTWGEAFTDETTLEEFSAGTVLETELETDVFSDGSALQEEPHVNDEEIKELEDGKLEANGVIYQYEAETDSYVIVGGTGQHTIKLRNDINGKKVIEIAPRAFYQDKVLEYIDGSYIGTVGESAFEGCTQLKNMPNVGEYVGKNAFNGCENLTMVNLFDGCYVSSGAFCNCPRLIRMSMYYQRQGDEDAFDADNKIVAYLEDGAGINTEARWGIRYSIPLDDPDSDYYYQIGHTEYIEGFLINCSEEAQGNIYIESEVPRAGVIKTIGRNAFYSCKGITSIYIPDTVTTIETKAFNRCEGLKRVEIPSSVTEIAEDAFTGCSNVVIYTSEGSYAEQFAKTYGIPCITEKNLATPTAPFYKKVTGNVATASLKAVEGAEGYQVIIGYKDCDKNGNFWQIKDTNSLTVSFDHVRHGTFYSYVRAYKTEDGEKIYSDWSDGSAVYVQAFTPSTPKFNGITVSGSTVIVDMRCDKNWTGYDVVLGKSKNSIQPTNYAYIAKNQKRGRIVFKNVKKGTYYVGAHTFNRTGTTSAKVFSQWSDIRKITIK